MPQQNVVIKNEAGTGVVANGVTNDGGSNVTQLTNPVVLHYEYQINVGGGKPKGALCTEYDAIVHTAKFKF